MIDDCKTSLFQVNQNCATVIPEKRNKPTLPDPLMVMV